MLEKTIEKKLREEITKAGGQCLKWECPGKRGAPDRIVILPNGKIYFVELKTENGRVSVHQSRFLQALARLGCDARVVFGMEGVKLFLSEVLQP